MRNHAGSTMTIYDIPGIINTSLPLAATQMNIINGFRVSGIFPFNRLIFDNSEFLPSNVTDRRDPKEGTFDRPDSKESSSDQINTNEGTSNQSDPKKNDSDQPKPEERTPERPFPINQFGEKYVQSLTALLCRL